MRVRSFTLSLALLMGCSSLGCKSAPKLPWFGAAGKSAEATATVAQTATQPPQLPSEIAKQTEALSTNPVKISPATAAISAPPASSSAPAYSATNINPYPNTGAQGYLPTNTASTIAPAPASTVASSKAALPYDPDAVPPASSAIGTASATVNAPAPTDRYGMTNQDRYANAYPTTSAPTSTPSAYPTTGPAASPPSDNTAGLPASASVPFVSNPGSSSSGDRYATQNTPAPSPVSARPSFNAEPVQPASAVASVQPYRPGGTSSYPGTSANYEVATRPGTTTAPSTYPSQGATLYR